MTTLTKTYATEVAARRAVEALRATGVAERDIRLLVGSAPRDIRQEPVGGFAGRERQRQAALSRALAENVAVRQVNANGMWVATSGTDAVMAYLLEVTGAERLPETKSRK